MTRSLRLSILSGLMGAWSVLLAPSISWAQLYTADPYDPFNRPYRSFTYPNAGNNPALPNAARYGSGMPIGSGGGGGGNLSDRLGADYSLEQFRFDDPFGRGGGPNGYVPNGAADVRYREDRARREALTAKVLLERDPKKKAELQRELQNMQKAEVGEIGPSIRRGSTPPGVKIPPAPGLNRNRYTASAAPAASGRGTTKPSTSTAAPRARSTTTAKPGSGSTSAIPPAPGLPSARAGRSEPSALDVLNRSRRMTRSSSGSSDLDSIGPSRIRVPSPSAPR